MPAAAKKDKKFIAFKKMVLQEVRDFNAYCDRLPPRPPAPPTPAQPRTIVLDFDAYHALLQAAKDMHALMAPISDTNETYEAKITALRNALKGMGVVGLD